MNEKTSNEQKTQLSSTALQNVAQTRTPSKHYGEIEQLTKGEVGRIYHARVFDLLKAEFRGKEGKVDIFDIVDGLDCTRVLILVTDQHGEEKIVLVEQDRQKVVNEATGEWGKRVIELPGGAIEREISNTGQIKSENVISNALKEAIQEAGVVALNASPLYPAVVNGNVKDSGFGTSKVFWYKITGTVTLTENTPEKLEGKVRVLFLTVPEALAMIQSGEITDGITIPPILQLALEKKEEEISKLKSLLLKNNAREE